MDTVRIKKGELLIIKDTIYAPKSDTQIYIQNLDYRLKKNPYQTSENFYKRMREISGQSKITARLFDLLYVERSSKTEIAKKPESRNPIEPFLPYEKLRIGSSTTELIGV